MIEIVSLDDHPIFGVGIKECLQAVSVEFQVTVFTQPDEALLYISNSHTIDLVLLDIFMPDINGISFLEAMQNRGLFVPIVIMSAADDLRLYKKAIELGVVGIISKDQNPDDMVKSIQRVVDGDIVIPESMLLAMKELPKEDVLTPDKILSKRQLEILKMIQAGLSNTDIASVLYISQVTVKSHLHRVFKILGAKNRVECVRKAERLNILPRQK